MGRRGRRRSKSLLRLTVRVRKAERKAVCLFTAGLGLAAILYFRGLTGLVEYNAEYDFFIH